MKLPSCLKNFLFLWSLPSIKVESSSWVRNANAVLIIPFFAANLNHNLTMGIDCLLRKVFTVLPFLSWVCLLPICSIYKKHSTQEVLQLFNKVAKVKYWILFSVCDSVLWSFLIISIFISILIDHYPVSPQTDLLDPLTPLPNPLRKEKLLPQHCCKILPRNLTCLYVNMPHTGNS